MLLSKYDLTKERDVPLYASPASVQEVFSIKSIDASGIFELPDKRWSKLYTLSDINFSGISENEQKAMVKSFARVLKTMTCRFSISVANEYVDEKQFHERILFPFRDDSFDDLRRDYNTLIQEKVAGARQGLYQTIYLTLTIKAEDIREARSVFKSMNTSIHSAFNGMGVNGMRGSVMREVSINDRMQMIYNFTHAGIMHNYRFNFQRELSLGRDWSNLIAPPQLRFETEFFRMNGKYGKVMYIDKYPNSLVWTIIDTMSRMKCTSFVTMGNELIDIGCFKQEIARKYMGVGMKIENEKQRNRSNNDFLADASEKLLDQKAQLDALSKELDTTDEHYFNSTIFVMFLTDTKEQLKQVEDKLIADTSLGSYELKSCFARQREGLNSVLCLGIQEFKHVVNLSSTCLAMFMPFKTQELNDPNGIYFGNNQLSQNVIFVNRKKLSNHNGLSFGQSGKGKSTVNKLSILSTRLNEPDDQVIVVDPQAEYVGLCKNLGGTLITFDALHDYFLNPLDVDFENADYSKELEIAADKTDFILTLISSCMRRELTAEEKGIIDKVTGRILSENYAMRKRLGGAKENSKSYNVPGYMKKEETNLQFKSDLTPEEQIRAYSPTLQDIYQGLEDYGSEEADHLAAAMEIYVNGSLNLFNHRTNVDLSNKFIVFNLSGLQENLRASAMLIMMETVRARIKENAGSKQWTHLFIDEFHELLAIPQVEDFVLKLWKEIRKMNGIITGITQDFTDLLKGENNTKLSAIISNTEMFVLLSQSSIDKNKLMKFLPGISPAMFTFVENADPGLGLLIAGNTCVPFDLKIDKDSRIYELVSTDGGMYGV